MCSESNYAISAFRIIGGSKFYLDSSKLRKAWRKNHSTLFKTKLIDSRPNIAS